MKMAYKHRELTSKVQKAMKDPELLSQRATLALLQVRTMELINNIDTEEAQMRMTHLRRAWNHYKSVRIPGESIEMAAYKKLDAIITGAISDFESWEQIFVAMELNRKVSESETKRLVVMNQVINAEDVMDLIFKLLDVVKDTIRDPRQLKEIQTGFVQLVGAGDSNGIGERSGQADIFGSDPVDPTELLDP